MGIDSPSDLKGKRVGVNEYQQTAALWARGFFQHEYGVADTDVEWWMERTPELSHGGATGFRAPPGVTLHYMDPAKGENLGGMMANGELDAVYVYFTGSGINRSTLDLHAHEQVRTLFPSRSRSPPATTQRPAYTPSTTWSSCAARSTSSIPGLRATSTTRSSGRKTSGLRGRWNKPQPFIDAGLLPPEARAALSTDLFPYGVAANRHTLETALAYSTEQGLTSRVVTIEELVAPTLLDT